VGGPLSEVVGCRRQSTELGGVAVTDPTLTDEQIRTTWREGASPVAQVDDDDDTTDAKDDTGDDTDTTDSTTTDTDTTDTDDDTTDAS
jgi:hypothetical protein